MEHIFIPFIVMSMPVSFVWPLVILWKPKSEALAILAATMVVNSHMVLYMHMGYLAFYPSEAASKMFCATMMASLALAGLALLLDWDNHLDVRAEAMARKSQPPCGDWDQIKKSLPGSLGKEDAK
jgi:hypothetical protein